MNYNDWINLKKGDIVYFKNSYTPRIIYSVSDKGKVISLKKIKKSKYYGNFTRYDIGCRKLFRKEQKMTETTIIESIEKQLNNLIDEVKKLKEYKNLTTHNKDCAVTQSEIATPKSDKSDFAQS